MMVISLKMIKSKIYPIKSFDYLRKSILSSIVLLLLFNIGNGQVVLDADGPGNTYELISSILAPGYNPIETPDCGHLEFGEHIDEIYDDELDGYIFRFHIHVTPDNDRCLNFDRQRNEIKTYDKSPDNLLGTEGEKIIYKWKFKLAPGFQSSPNFTHLHQLKSVGGSLASMPMYTLTTRKGNPDQLELRYAETDNQITLLKTDLEPFIGTWLDVTEIITYGIEGTYELTIKSISDNETLFFYSTNSIINWRPGADFVRPKWGIYRSLLNEQDLRDEQVLYSSFSIEENNVSSTALLSRKDEVNISYIDENRIHISNLPKEINSIQLFSINGKQVFHQDLKSKTELLLDYSSFPGGIYILKFQGKKIKQSKMVMLH